MRVKIRRIYNRGDYKVFQTNEAIIGGRDDPYGLNFTDKNILYFIISISEI